MARTMRAVKDEPQRGLDLREVEPPIASIDGLDEEIREVALLEVQIVDKENELNAIITDVQSRLGPAVKALKEQKAAKTDRILSYARQHKDAVFGEKKSRKFNFGKLSLTKAAEAVKFVLDEDKIIANLKKLALAIGVVKSKEWVDKDALRDAVTDPKTRDKVGFTIVPTGGEPKLEIDRKAVEILRSAGQQKKVS